MTISEKFIGLLEIISGEIRAAVGRYRNSLVDTEDLEQAIFLELWDRALRGVMRLDNVNNVIAYVRHVAPREASREVRVNGRRGVRGRRHLANETCLALDWRDEDVRDERLGLEEALDRQEARMAVWRALDRMDKNDRELLVRYFMDEDPLTEMAEEQAVTYCAMWRRLKKASEKMKSMFHVELFPRMDTT